MRRTFLLVAAIWLAAGCAPIQTVRVELREYAFVPNRIEVKAGARVRLEVVNWGRERHDLFIEGVDQATYWLSPLRYEVLEFQAPRQPGVFRVVCSVPGHVSKGMVGEFVVIR